MSVANQTYKNVQDTIAAAKKANREWDLMEVSLLEARRDYDCAKSNSSTKDKELSKLAAKLSLAEERAFNSKEIYTNLEQTSRTTNESYHNSIVPKMFQDIQFHQMERFALIKSVLEKYNFFEYKMEELNHNSLRDIGKNLAKIDVGNDIEYFAKKYFTDKTQLVSMLSPAEPPSNEIMRGLLEVKRDGANVSWKSRLAILNKKNYELTFFESNNSGEAKDVIVVKDCSVYPIDFSFYGKPCFLLVYHVGKKPLFYSCVTHNDKMRDEWVQVLQKYTRCCDICAKVNGYNSQLQLNEYIQKDSLIKRTRSIQLRISEAKDLVQQQNQRSAMFYCSVVFDDVMYFKTVPKASDSSTWNELIEYKNISPHFSRIRIVLFQAMRVGKDIPVGYVKIDLKVLKNGVEVSEWFTLKPFENEGAVGSLRLSVTLYAERILPSEAYTSFFNLITEPPFTIMKEIGQLIPKEREEFARESLRMLTLMNKDQDVVRSLLSDEIQATEDANILFRENTVATKFTEQYIKLVGANYLKETLRPAVVRIFESTEFVQLDPTQQDDIEQQKNIKLLLHYVNLFWIQIQSSIENMPTQIVKVLSYSQGATNQKFKDGNSKLEDAQYASISGFLFLRFFCPAIISPHMFNILDEPEPPVKKTLTLIAKVLQNLANLREVKDKTLMGVNAYIRAQRDNMKEFLSKATTVSGVFVDIKKNRRRRCTRASQNV